MGNPEFNFWLHSLLISATAIICARFLSKISVLNYSTLTKEETQALRKLIVTQQQLTQQLLEHPEH